jgi:hypothetical protein
MQTELDVNSHSAMYFLGHLEQVALTSLSLSFPICTQANHTCFAVWQ